MLFEVQLLLTASLINLKRLLKTQYPGEVERTGKLATPAADALIDMDSKGISRVHS
jgi:hypothetical protein